tara:strand:- start:447 stop:1664 length:1218 start_codon:yes stop_codon:yes gene_type:complete
MDENMKTEIENGAKAISLSAEEAMNKFEEICSENSIETTNPVAKGLWRNFVANVRRTQDSGKTVEQGNDSFYKSAFGFFVSLEAPRDMMAWNRMKAKEEFLRDSDGALESGVIAVANQNALGKWVVSRYHNDAYDEKTISSLPSGAEETEDGRFFIPLDNTAVYMNGGKNDNYGKPLPSEQMRRSGVFYGSLGTGEMQPYYFSYKNQGGIDFAPNTFEWCHFMCVLGSNGTDIYGAKTMTADSLTMNTDMDTENDLYRNMGEFDFEQCLKDNFNSNLVPLVEMDRAHIQRQALPSKERYVVTDGTVCNMNMQPTKNGNRIINITDLNAELDYENDSGMTTCWIPEHLTLDFGIGSTVIVVGRTSQRTTDEGVEPTTINVAGILCTVKHGSAIEISQPVEENFDWF